MDQPPRFATLMAARYCRRDRETLILHWFVTIMIDWPRALAWRMRQQLLEPVGTESVAGVVRRLGAVPAQSDASAELAIRSRRAESKAGEVTDALAAGRIIRTFAFRGATHLLTPEEGAAYLALRASSRMWELPSWQSFYQLSPSDWPPFRAAVRDALVDGPRTREELGAIVVSRPEFRHLQSAFSDRALTLLKPLAWQGDISFGPPRDGRATFQRLDRNAHWAGLPDIDEAGLQAVEAYLRTYGPATPEHLRYWLGEGLGVARKRIQSWIAGLADRVAAIDIEGDSAYVRRDDLADLEGTPPSSGVRLLPGHDQWVLGPGTADHHVVPPARRKVVTRGSNLVIVGGVVSGTWSIAQDRVIVAWFSEIGTVPKAALTEQVDRLATLLERPLESTIQAG